MAVRGLKSSIDALTDAQGRYGVTLPPGTSQITAFPPPVFSARHLRRAVALRDARGCFVADFGVRLDVHVNGVVRHASGEPAVGAVVEVIGAVGERRQERIRSDTPCVNRRERDLRIHRDVARTIRRRCPIFTRGLNRDVVFPKTFYPGTSDPALATVVQLDGAQHRELEPLTLPPARRPYRLTGTVVFDDGRPASGESVTLRDGSATWAQVGGGGTGLDERVSLSYTKGSATWPVLPTGTRRSEGNSGGALVHFS